MLTVPVRSMLSVCTVHSLCEFAKYEYAPEHIELVATSRQRTPRAHPKRVGYFDTRRDIVWETLGRAVGAAKPIRAD